MIRPWEWKAHEQWIWEPTWGMLLGSGLVEVILLILSGLEVAAPFAR